MSISTATDGGVCLVCGDPLAPRSTAHCGDPDCRATVRAAKARVTYAAKHGVDLPLWEAIADANVGGTLPHFSVPHSGKGSADPLSTPKDAGLVFIYDNPGFSLHVGGDAGDNLRQSRVDEASLFDPSVPSLMVAPSDDRSAVAQLSSTLPSMIKWSESYEVSFSLLPTDEAYVPGGDNVVTHTRRVYERSPKADTSTLAKLPNSNEPVTIGNDAPVSSWQVNQRAHGLPADLYAFSADALITAAGVDDDAADIFSAANIAAGLSDPFAFMVDALSESADAAKVREWALGNLADVGAVAVYGVASAFTSFVAPDTYIDPPGLAPCDPWPANPPLPEPVYFGTIDAKVRLHNKAYAHEHAVIAKWLIAPKTPKVLPPVVPAYDGPTVHAVYDRAGYLLPTSLPVAAVVGHLPLFVESSAWHKASKHVRPVDGLGCYPCNPKGVAFCDGDGQHGYVAPGSGLVHDVQYVGPWPAAGDAHVLIGRGSIPVHLVDAAAWPVAGAVRTSADYVTLPKV